MPTIHIPTPLRPYVDKQESVEVAGRTVREALANLTSTYGDLRKHLYNDEGKLRSFVNIYLNDEDIRYLQKEDTALQASDALSIIPSVAGGAPTRPRTNSDGARAADLVGAGIPALQPAPDPSRGRPRGAAQAEGGARPLRRRRRPRLAGGALPRRRRRRHHRHRRLRRRRSVEPAAPDHPHDRRHRPPEAGVGEGQDQRDEPGGQRPDLRGAAHVEERARDLQGLRRDPGRHRQLPDALPGERRLRAARHAERLRIDLPLRGPGVGVRRQGRPVLPLPLSRAAAAGAGAELRGGRRARRAARHHRHDPGDRGGEDHPRHRRAADRPLRDLRRAEDALPRAEAAQGSGLPGVRHEPDRHGADRLRAVLRHAGGRVVGVADRGAGAGHARARPASARAACRR